MLTSVHTPYAASSQNGQVRSTLVEIFSGITGISPASLAGDSTFLELGMDSLLLLQASQAIHQRLRSKVPLKSLLDELTTLDALAAHLETKVLASRFPRKPAGLFDSTSNGAVALPTFSDSPASRVPTPVTATQGEAPGPRSLDAIARQLLTLSQQLANYCKQPVNAPAEKSPLSAENSSARPSSASIARGNLRADLSEHQREHLGRLVAALSAKTAKSKHRAQAYRTELADSVVSANFRLAWKEICYPIIVERASGARAWDIDGNEYVDVAMGFGALLFGHSPGFVQTALEEQVQRGMRLGFQSDLAGEVAALICELTGLQRVAFCNSGTEAVMTALRLARAATGRSRIALFNGLYHGTFDGVLAGSIRKPGGLPCTVPRASGIPQKMVDDVLVLPFGDRESLDILSQQASELAAVLVEPAPWWNTNVDLGEFLRELRAITQASGAALLFDEVVVGFRMHPGGAQSLYKVRADLVTYGKALGAGMPVGVIAGDHKYMDAIDGGQWEFGDSSSPQADTTLFAGTFFKHPMVMAAAHSVLKHIKESGPQLQEQLTARTAAMTAELNSYFQARDLPLQVAQFGSGFNFAFAPEISYKDVFFHHLIHRGVYVCDTRKCYLSTAHSDQDIAFVSDAIKQSAEEMREGGFLTRARQVSMPVTTPLNPAPQAAASGSTLVAKSYPMTEAQKGLWTLSCLSPEVCAAYNESINIRFHGSLDVAALRSALAILVQRHDSLRTTFSADGTTQRIAPQMRIELPLIDLTDHQGRSQRSELYQLLVRGIDDPCDLEHGPLLRARLFRLESHHHVLALVAHHIVIDGWSRDILLRELGALYSAETLGLASHLSPPVSYSVYADACRSEGESGGQQNWSEQDEAFWLACYSDGVPVIRFPTDRAHPPVQSYAGARMVHVSKQDLSRKAKSFAEMAGCTTFTFLLAVFQLVLRDITGQEDMIVGVHLAGQSMLAESAVSGYCIEMLPLRGTAKADSTFQQHLSSVKTRLSEALQHHAFPMSQLVRKLKLRRDPTMPPMVTVIFNMDPAPTSTLAAKGKGENSVPPWWGLSCEFLANPKVFARFEQVWNVMEIDGQLAFDCTYNTDLFDAETIKATARHFERLIKYYAARLGVRLNAINSGRPRARQTAARLPTAAVARV